MPTYVMFKADGEPARSEDGNWLGIVDNGNGNLFNLRNPVIRQSFQVEAKSNIRSLIFLFNCPRQVAIGGIYKLKAHFDNPGFSGLDQQRIKRVFEMRENEKLLKTIAEINTDLLGLTAARLNIIRSGMNFLAPILNNGNSSNRIVGQHEITGAVVKIN